MLFLCIFFKDFVLLSAFQHFLKNSEKYSLLQMCNLLMAFAKLNFQPSNKELFYTKVTNQKWDVRFSKLCQEMNCLISLKIILCVCVQVHKVLESSWQSLEPFVLTDVVWALCIFQQAKPEFIAAVTDPAFQSKVTGWRLNNRKYSSREPKSLIAF